VPCPVPLSKPQICTGHVTPTNSSTKSFRFASLAGIVSVLCFTSIILEHPWMRRHHQSHSLGLARINLNKHENRWIREQCTESRPVSYGIGAPRLYPDFWLAVVDKLKKLQWIKREDNRDLEDARFEKNTGNIETQPFCLCGWGQSSVKIKGAVLLYFFI
jgi:hypothetical protein